MEGAGSTAQQAYASGTAFAEAERYDKAETAFLKATRLFRKDKHRKERERAVAGLAAAMRYQRKYDEALVVYEKQQFPLIVVLYSTHSIQYYTALSGIIECNAKLGRFDEAHKFAETQCELATDLFGGAESEAYGFCVMRVGDVRQEQADHVGAVEAYERAKRLIAPTSKNYHVLISNMAASLKHTGQYDRALAMHKEDLAVTLKQFGDQHSIYAMSLCNAAYFYGELKCIRRAIDYSAMALKIRERRLGAAHPDTVNARCMFEAFCRVNFGDDRHTVQQLVGDKRVCAACDKIMPCAAGGTAWLEGDACSACLMVHYCSVECQLKDWPAHKVLCKLNAKGPLTDRCAQCGAHGDEWRCGQCEAISYCGEQCQLQHWASHEKWCCGGGGGK